MIGSMQRGTRRLAALGVVAFLMGAAVAPAAAADRPVAQIVFEYSCNATGTHSVSRTISASGTQRSGGPMAAG